MLTNLLEVSTNFIPFTVETIGINNLNFIGKLIQGLIEGVGIIGVGIILFTLILKTIVLPLDIYSRVKTKKQSLIMKSMRPEMEKLQKQYENDKNMYNQKVMELQKQNGISMFSACIPMVITLVIFMVVFSAFSTYSQWANGTTYNEMVNAYNKSVQTYVVVLNEEKENVNEKGFLIEERDDSIGETAYKVDFELFKKVCSVPDDFDEKLEGEKMALVREFVKDNARKAAADYYRGHKNGFLWIRNIWYPDSPLNKEVPTFSSFSSSVSRATSGIDASYEEYYDEVIHYLKNPGYEVNGKYEGDRVNGYFVLIVLAIGLMFLQQFIMMRAQKDANELSTVDGSGAKQNKWMMIMMPIIYGVFSFFYSAAFSLYMITNTIYGLITTLIINKVMDNVFKKMEANGGYTAKRKAKKNQNNRKRLK